MKKPIEIYKSVLKEFGIEGPLDNAPVQKISYIQEQVTQQKMILNRLFFDLTTSLLKFDEAQDDMSKDAHRKKSDDYRNDIRQILGALKINLDLIDQLREEYPELQVKS